jgi:hypothetical protein
MNQTYPKQFQSFDDWCDYSDYLEHSWKENSFWGKYTSEDWIRLYPEMKTRVSEHLLASIDHRDTIQDLYNRTEATFSQDLNERLFEEALLNITLGKALSNLDKKINTYRRMVLVDRPPVEGQITQDDINKARQVPMDSLIDRPIKKGQMLCLFHEEKTPSCKVYPDHIHCFGCGKSLDTIGYIMETQGKTFINSVKYLCNK